MPRASKIDNNRKVFYWEDTGAVEVTVDNAKIVQAIDPNGETWKAEEVKDNA